jgi:hypothetical protein
MDKAHHHRNKKRSNLPLSRSKAHGMRCTRKRIDEMLSASSSAQSAGSVDIEAYIVAGSA